MLSKRQQANIGLALVVLLIAGSVTILLAQGKDGGLAQGVILPGHAVPLFALRETSGAEYISSRDHGSVTVLLFANPHDCPVAQDYADRYTSLYEAYRAQPGVQVYLVTPRRCDIAMPQLIDEDGRVAAALGVSSPECLVLDQENVLRYRGSFDDSRDSGQVTNRFVIRAIQTLLMGQPALAQSNVGRGL